VPGPKVLAKLLAPTAGYSLIAEDPAGAAIALANLMWTADGAELAVLVEDAWQRQRIGTALAGRLATAAAAEGVAEFQTLVHAGNTPMIRIMAGIGHRLHREFEGGLLTLVASVGAPGRQIHRSSHM
jgi:RimJ/RimL family protein N-acetyltransferase